MFPFFNLKSILFVVFISFFCTTVNAADEAPPVSFDFQTIKVTDALQLLADYRGLNLVVDESISGSLSMRMREVSWDEAIEYVASAKGLLYTVDGRFLRVSRLPRPGDAPYSSNAAYQSFSQSPAAPVNPTFKTAILRVQNILSSEAVKAFPLDQGETLTPEDGSSVIVARMSPERLSDFRDFLSAVDYSRKQVMIQARIVEVDRAYSKNLGVQWSADVRRGSASLGGSVPLGLSSAAAAGFGIVSKAVNLDATLTAMEQSGNGRVISSPRVYTSDRRQAKIVKGSQVPYQQSAGEGSTSTSFKEAALSLDVTPQVNDQGVFLDVVLSKDEPDYSKSMNGVPPINTTSLTSRVFSGFGQTVALGGVYSDTDSTVVKAVPVLGSIPGLKWLFTSKSTVSNSTELVLFLTPVLMDNPSVTSYRK